jgi:uncharacterized RDD family membrane protein YckC
LPDAVSDNWAVSQPYAPPRDPTEVLGRRLAAFAIDLAFLVVIGVILFAAAKHHSFYDAPPDACSQITRTGSSFCLQISDRLYVWESDAYTRVAVLGGVAGFLDLVVLQTVTGASIGKLCVGLRVIEVQGNEARFLRVLGRWLFLVVDLGLFVVGLVTTLVTHPHRRVGDLVCGTYVVGVASVGRPVVVLPPAPPAFGAGRSAYRAPRGAPVPPGWGTPTVRATVPPPAPIATPPGTSPTTPGEWGAVARPGPALVRSPQWEEPPPGEQPVPVARDTVAPQWSTPPVPKAADEAEPEQHGVAEPMPAPEAASEPLAAAPQWSPVVPLTTTGDDSHAGAPPNGPIQPPPPPRAPWSPAAPEANGDPTPPAPPPPAPLPTEANGDPPAAPPPPPLPTEPSPRPPTEPDPPPPAAANRPDPDPVTAVPEPDDDVPWWDADG